MDYAVFARDETLGENHVAPSSELAIHVAASDCACSPEVHLRVSDETGEARWTWLHCPMEEHDD